MAEEVKDDSWRQRMQAIGKETFTLEEMVNLGFWPLPEDPEASAKRDAATALLLEKRPELESLQERLSQINAEISRSSNVQIALQRIRGKG